MGRPEPTGTIETVTGPIDAGAITSALAHEHLFVDFTGPASPEYCLVDWSVVAAICTERLAELRELGVELVVECTGIGIGRNVDLLREVSRATGIRLVCATGSTSRSGLLSCGAPSPASSPTSSCAS